MFSFQLPFFTADFRRGLLQLLLLGGKVFRGFFQILLRSQELLLFFSQVLRQAGRHVGISQKRQLTAEIAVARVFLWKLRSQHWLPFILRVHKNSGVHGNSGRSKELQHGSLQRHVSKGHGDEDDCLLVMLASLLLPAVVCCFDTTGSSEPGFLPSRTPFSDLFRRQARRRWNGDTAEKQKSRPEGGFLKTS